MKRPLLALTGAAILIAACWNTTREPRYCDATSPCIDTALKCDLVLSECVAKGGDDLGGDGADLTGACASSKDCAAATPICAGQVCKACAAGDDAECGMRDAATPRCLVSAGSCVACQPQMPSAESSDCKTAGQTVCGAAGACRACAANSECASGICAAGTCVAEAAIAYVDNNKTPCAGADGTRAKPYCQITDALATTSAYIRVEGSATTYAAITIADRSVTIVGPGKAATPTAHILTLGVISVNVTITTGAHQVVLDGLDLGGTTSMKSLRGVSVTNTTATPANATVTIRESRIHDSTSEGVLTSGALIFLLQDIVSGNLTGGIALNSGSSYTIENTFIVSNASTTTPALTIDASSNGVARFNTIAKNTNADGAAGANCVGTRELSDSIIVGNFGSGPSQTNGCTLKNVVTGGTDGATGSFAMSPSFVDAATDFHLKPADTANQACCVNKLGAGPAVDIDGSARPKGGMFDIGAHEVE